MGRYCQLVIGPAGSGKSTYCTAILQHLRTQKRSAICVNLDPAAEKFHYEPTIDIRDLITVDDVMDELHLGPNGGLMFSMEYLLENLDWFEEQLGTEWEDEYMLIDCPGQIELFTHSQHMQKFIHFLQTRLHFRVCVVHVLESQFMIDVTKYFAGVLTALSSMIHLHVPHINVMTKMDLIEGRPGELESMKQSGMLLGRGGRVDGDPEDDDDSNDESFPNPMASNGQEDILGISEPGAVQSGMANTWTEEEEVERDRRRHRAQLDHYLSPDPVVLLNRLNASVDREDWRFLNESLVRLIDDYNMVSFIPLNVHDEESMDELLLAVDHAIQFGEDEEPKEPRGDYDEDGNETNENRYDTEGIAEATWQDLLNK